MPVERAHNLVFSSGVFLLPRELKNDVIEIIWVVSTLVGAYRVDKRLRFLQGLYL